MRVDRAGSGDILPFKAVQAAGLRFNEAVITDALRPNHISDLCNVPYIQPAIIYRELHDIAVANHAGRNQFVAMKLVANEGAPKVKWAVNWKNPVVIVGKPMSVDLKGNVINVKWGCDHSPASTFLDLNRHDGLLARELLHSADIITGEPTEGDVESTRFTRAFNHKPVSWDVMDRFRLAIENRKSQTLDAYTIESTLNEELRNIGDKSTDYSAVSMTVFPKEEDDTALSVLSKSNIPNELAGIHEKSKVEKPVVVLVLRSKEGKLVSAVSYIEKSGRKYMLENIPPGSEADYNASRLMLLNYERIYGPDSREAYVLKQRLWRAIDSKIDIGDIQSAISRGKYDVISIHYTGFGYEKLDQRFGIFDLSKFLASEKVSEASQAALVV